MRELLVALVIPPVELRAIRREGERSRATHRAQITAILAVLKLSYDGEEAALWLDLATALKTKRRGLPSMTHRRAHQPAPPVDDAVRDRSSTRL